MPFTKNQIITLEIKSISNDGNGVAHKDGQAVFVPLTAPGDVAEVQRLVAVGHAGGDDGATRPGGAVGGSEVCGHMRPSSEFRGE